MQNRLSFLTSDSVNELIKASKNEKKQKLISLIAQNGIWALENEIRWIEHTIKEIKK